MAIHLVRSPSGYVAGRAEFAEGLRTNAARTQKRVLVLNPPQFGRLGPPHWIRAVGPWATNLCF